MAQEEGSGISRQEERQVGRRWEPSANRGRLPDFSGSLEG